MTRLPIVSILLLFAACSPDDIVEGTSGPAPSASTDEDLSLTSEGTGGTGDPDETGGKTTADPGSTTGSVDSTSTGSEASSSSGEAESGGGACGQNADCPEDEVCLRGGCHHATQVIFNTQFTDMDCFASPIRYKGWNSDGVLLDSQITTCMGEPAKWEEWYLAAGNGSVMIEVYDTEWTLLAHFCWADDPVDPSCDPVPVAYLHAGEYYGSFPTAPPEHKGRLIFQPAGLCADMPGFCPP